MDSTKDDLHYYKILELLLERYVEENHDQILDLKHGNQPYTGSGLERRRVPSDDEDE